MTVRYQYHIGFKSKLDAEFALMAAECEGDISEASKPKVESYMFNNIRRWAITLEG